ncbi:probable receptor-like protein kinase At1g30570 isoform X1 [Lactuca sativa]|uniref:probable receptor-like protein kinase At1g30570 isoform X1 n=1 Tax=Lactuca sativa TaxID=4236 RepID=UPI000CD9A622|nr:probable receptor-like protein kinase At1g30570 isoform X1 [Lactuca sativa]
MYFSTTLIFLLTVLGIVFYYLQKQQEEEDDSEQKKSSLLSLSDQQSQNEEQSKRKDSSTSASSDKLCQKFSLAEIKLATNDFDDVFVIGKGGFGKVYKGKIEIGEEGIDVAIKRLNLEHSSQGATEFKAEIEMLSQFRHSHIVSLLGYHEGSDKREMILVYEYMPNGSLDHHLHKIRANGSNSSLLTWIERLNICIGAARGLDYLHTGTSVQSRVIHRDIKSSNILLDENLAAKISDFGLSTIGPANLVGTTNVYTNQIRGTFGYMDAEYFATHRLTRKSDVYAFGVVLLEVLCGRPALDFTLDEQQHSLSVWAKQRIREGKIDRIIDPCLREQTRTKFLKEFGRIAYECVLPRSKDRPTMTKVVARLELVLAWTLQNGLSHIGRSLFIEKAWSLFLIKALNKDHMRATKKLGQSINNKKNGIMMEKHATTFVEGGWQSGDIATVSQQVVLPGNETNILILKIFKLSELQSATQNFSQDMVLGDGDYGKVYKGWLDSVTFAPRKAGDGLAVAIKRSKPDIYRHFREWQTKVKFLGTLSHPNVVKLLGYCRKKNKEFLLVYEYMQKGSLDMHLFREGAKPLPWETRIKIAMGAAQGLAFLHANNVIHRDVKTSNILFDKEFNAKLSDLGVAKYGPVNGESHITTFIEGTPSFLAPEYALTGCLYIKSDVFGFGVVMIELITGLRIYDLYSASEPSWLTRLERESLETGSVGWFGEPFIDMNKLQQIMDPRLEQVYPLNGALKLAKLILNCVEPEPIRRPSMEEVVAHLEEINSIK